MTTIADLFPVAELIEGDTGAQNAAKINALLQDADVRNVLLPPGKFWVDPIDMTHLYSTSLIGVRGVNNLAGGKVGTVLRPNTDGDPIIDMTGSLGCALKDFQLGWGDDSGYAGILCANSQTMPCASNRIDGVASCGTWALGGLHVIGVNDCMVLGGGFSNQSGASFSAHFQRDNHYSMHSPFQDISTGAHPCGNWTCIDTTFQNFDTSGADSGGAIYFRDARSMRFMGSLIASSGPGSGSRVIFSGNVDGSGSSMIMIGGGVYSEMLPNKAAYAFQAGSGTLTVYEGGDVTYDYGVAKTNGNVTILGL